MVMEDYVMRVTRATIQRLKNNPTFSKKPPQKTLFYYYTHKCISFNFARKNSDI